MNAPVYTIKIESARVYKLRTDQGFGWADITIREWPKGGAIDVQSDYGSYAYTWNSIGHGSFRAFLCNLDFGYFMGKAAGDYLRFDAGATAGDVRAMILERRKDGNLTAEEARELWDESGRVEECRTEHEYYDLIYGPLEGLGDAIDAPLRKAPSGQSLAFWRDVWPAVCAEWQKELAVANDNSIATRVAA